MVFDEIRFSKVNEHWIAFGVNNEFCGEGATKEIARNNYYLNKKIKEEIKVPTVDIGKYLPKM